MKLKDIGSDRMQIWERRRRVKTTSLSHSARHCLIFSEGLQAIRPAPKVHVFEGRGTPGSIYTVKTAQRIFQRPREKSGIMNEVSFHCVRHFFASHILEKGIDIRYNKGIWALSTSKPTGATSM